MGVFYPAIIKIAQETLGFRCSHISWEFSLLIFALSLLNLITFPLQGRYNLQYVLLPGLVCPMDLVCINIYIHVLRIFHTP